MVKTLVITLTDAVPDTVLSAQATVVIEGVNYAGKVTGIITHETSPAPTSVTLTGQGLAVA